jgi:hypothetical protein
LCILDNKGFSSNAVSVSQGPQRLMSPGEARGSTSLTVTKFRAQSVLCRSGTPPADGAGRSLPRKFVGASRAFPTAENANGPQEVRLPGLRYPKPGSVSRRRGGTKPAEAPVQSEQHALDVEIDVVVVTELIAAALIEEVAVVVEIVEIGEAILGA